MGTKYLPDEMRYLAGSRQSQPVGWVEHRTQSDMGRADNPRDGDENGHALMFGLYLGQVSARIQRAWIRPRSPVEGGSFACRVQIAQSMSGAVQEVTLQQCNGDLRWMTATSRRRGAGKSWRPRQRSRTAQQEQAGLSTAAGCYAAITNSRCN